MTFEEAVGELGSPSTWCKGAAELAKIGGQRSLLALVRAYEAPIESSRLCLLDALVELDARRAAPTIFDEGDAEHRRLALHLMELFADESFLERMENAARDPDTRIRAQARRALSAQRRTDSWEAAVIRLLETGDREAQAMALECLASRKSPAAQAALAAYHRA